MAESLTIARPYAEAAFKIAIEQQALPAWSDALARLSFVLQRPEAVALVSNPSLSAAQITDVIADSAGQLSGEQKNFVRVLADNERLAVVNEIIQHFVALRNDHKKCSMRMSAPRLRCRRPRSPTLRPHCKPSMASKSISRWRSIRS